MQVKIALVSLPLIAVCTIITIFLSLSSCSTYRNRKHIESVLEQNKLISERAPKASLISAEGNIRETLDLDIDAWLIRCEFIVNEMQAIDLSGCPDDFAQAYRNHCGSWFIAWKVFNNMKDDNIIYYSIIHKYNARIRKIRETDKAIHDTYNKLLELASQYRVQISRYQGQYGLVSLHN